MKLTQAQIQHLGKLSQIHAKDDIEISNILDSFTSLNSVDTPHMDHPSRSGLSYLMLRPDSISSATTGDSLLSCSGQKKAGHQIVLGGIMVGE